MIHMRFYKKLYISPSLQKKKRQIIWRLKIGKAVPFVYVTMYILSQKKQI